MKYLTTGALSLFAVSLLAGAILAQPPGGPQGMRGGRGGGQGRSGAQGQQSGHQPPMNLLLMALNANQDQEISAAEIKKAAASLKKLDRNSDGKLTIDELMPSGPPPFGGRGQGGRFGGPGQGGPGQGGPGQGGLGQGGPGGPGGHGGPGQGGPGGPGNHLVDQLMGLDTDENGKITKKEFLKGMQSSYEKGDLNEDGVIDKEEAEKLVEELIPAHGGPGGRQDEGRAGRPQRPQG